MHVCIQAVLCLKYVQTERVGGWHSVTARYLIWSVQLLAFIILMGSGLTVEHFAQLKSSALHNQNRLSHTDSASCLLITNAPSFLIY